MKDKCVLVTGSSSGIGYEITLKLLDLGAKVIGISRNHDRSKLENKNYTTYKCDVSAHQKLEILLKELDDSRNKFLFPDHSDICA